MFFSVIIFVLSLLVLVVIHELGHFLVAKYFKIKVLEFGFGIPPRAWGKKVGETLVSLNWLPFGGFVRLLGEDEVDKKLLEDKRSFAAQTVWKRIAVVVAGVFMNLLMAWFLFYITLGANGFKNQIPLLTPHHFAGVDQQNENVVLIRDTSENSPAKSVGIKSGDRVLKINDKPVTSGSFLIKETKEHAGKEVTLTLSDPDGKNIKTLKVTPRANPPQGEGPMGVGLSEFQVANITYTNPILSAPIHSYNLTVYSGEVLGAFIADSFKQKSFEPVAQTVSGPVGITSVANAILTSSANPIIPYLDFMAVISLNLALMNVLPFPALDGGRLFFLLIEAITRKRVNPEFERITHTVGFGLLIALIVLVTYGDIRKLIGI